MYRAYNYFHFYIPHINVLKLLSRKLNQPKRMHNYVLFTTQTLAIRTLPNKFPSEIKHPGFKRWFIHTHTPFLDASFFPISNQIVRVFRILPSMFLFSRYTFQNVMRLVSLHYTHRGYIMFVGDAVYRSEKLLLDFTSLCMYSSGTILNSYLQSTNFDQFFFFVILLTRIV